MPRPQLHIFMPLLPSPDEKVTCSQ
jgi:hypothetical protein